MNLLEIKNKLNNRKEFNTKDTRRRNIILRKIEELESLDALKEEEEGLLITTVEELANYVDKCVDNGEYVLDLETTGLDCFEDSIVGVCMYTPSMKPCYIPILHTDIENNLLEGQLKDYVVKAFVDKLVNSDAKMINQNIK